jgi:predicted ATPase/DNA-binding SARP family transcriptional activator
VTQAETPSISLRLLGPPAVLVGGEAASGLPRKSEALLYLLGVSGRSWTRSEVSEMLWDDGDTIGRQNLRVALAKLPKACGEALCRDGDRLELAASHDLDLWRERCKSVHASLADTDAPGAEAELHAHCRALADWPGHLLEGFEIDAPQFGDWLYAERQLVQRRWEDTVLASVERLAARQRWQGPEAALQRLLQLNAGHETAHRWLMQCFMATGRPEAARSQYELCKRQMATLVGAAPSEATRAVLHATEVAVAMPMSPVRPAPASAAPNNLPRQVNSFVGRQVNSFVGRQCEMSEVAALLKWHRLVTLVGTGGIGKTRLSLQVGAQLLDEFPDGVWFADFTPLREAPQLAQQLAMVLAIREESGQPVMDAIEKFVRDRRLLIILDNCEHVVEGAAELAMRLLQAGEHVVVLATIRERLRTAGEAAYDLLTLDLPADAATIPLADLLALDAVHLFVDRAAAARYDFQLSGDNVAGVLSICRRLDGIPLAIELAAARVRTLSVNSIAGHLNNRFRLPGTGDRGQSSRQQTLETLIDWSYRLLDENEATLFRRLSIFAGGWTLAAAEDVAAGDGLERQEITDLLVRLAEKSLVFYDADSDRYRMLETVRHFARGQLDASPEVDEARERHVRYFLALAETARPHLAGAQQAEWLARLDAERENLLAAFARSAALDDGADLGARFVHSLRPHWMRRGLMAVALESATQVLSRPGMEIRDERRCETLFHAGLICNFSGCWSAAREHLSECLEIARETGNSILEAAVLQQLGRTCFELEDQDAARVFLEQGVALAERLGDPRETAWACNSLAQCLRLEGQTGAAKSLYERALAIARELGDKEQIAIFLLNLAMLSVSSLAFNYARQMLREALAIVETTGSRPVGQSVIEVCAGLAAANADWQVSAGFYGAAEEHSRITGLRRDATDQAFLAPLIAKTRQALGADEFADAEAVSSKLPFREVLREAGCWLAAGTCEPNLGQ